MSGSNLKLRTAPVYEPLLQPARYKGAWWALSAVG
jgi:hypothetical protein